MRPGWLSNSIDAAVAADQVLRDAQAESGAVATAGHQRIEDACRASPAARPGRRPRPGRWRPGDDGAGRCSRWTSARVRSTMRPRSPSACRALRATFSSAWIIWLRSTCTAGQARVVVALDRDARRRFDAQQVIDVLTDLVDVELRLVRRARTGPSIVSTSVRSRSASLMMTVVYSFRPPSCSSRSSSCAAPRRPPSGFLISWASCRTIRRLPSSRASSSFSRVMRWRSVRRSAPAAGAFR